jgi:hypothetical protein
VVLEEMVVDSCVGGETGYAGRSSIGAMKQQSELRNSNHVKGQTSSKGQYSSRGEKQQKKDACGG